MLCRAKQARKRGGYAAAVLAPAALGIRVYAPANVCATHRTHTRHVRLNQRRRWENGRSQSGGDDAKYISRLTRNTTLFPLSAWSAQRDREEGVTARPKSSTEKNRARDILQDDEISRTKHLPTTQNRSTGCARTEATQPRLVTSVLRGSFRQTFGLVARTAGCLRSVSCARQADLWIFKKSTVNRRCQTNRATFVGGRAGWVGWLANMRSKRSGGGTRSFRRKRGVRVDARGWPTPSTSLTPPSRVGPPPSLVFHLLHHPELLQSRRRATHT